MASTRACPDSLVSNSKPVDTGVMEHEFFSSKYLWRGLGSLCQLFRGRLALHTPPLTSLTPQFLVPASRVRCAGVAYLNGVPVAAKHYNDRRTRIRKPYPELPMTSWRRVVSDGHFGPTERSVIRE